MALIGLQLRDEWSGMPCFLNLVTVFFNSNCRLSENVLEPRANKNIQKRLLGARKLDLLLLKNSLNWYNHRFSFSIYVINTLTRFLLKWSSFCEAQGITVMGLKTSLIYQIFSPFCKHFLLIPKDNFDFSQRILQFVFFFYCSISSSFIMTLCFPIDRINWHWEGRGRWYCQIWNFS